MTSSKVRLFGELTVVRDTVALGYTFTDADDAVRAVLAEGEVKGADELIRRALKK